MSPTELELSSLQAVPCACGTGEKHTPAWHAGAAKQTGGAGQSLVLEHVSYCDG